MPTTWQMQENIGKHLMKERFSSNFVIKRAKKAIFARYNNKPVSYTHLTWIYVNLLNILTSDIDLFFIERIQYLINHYSHLPSQNIPFQIRYP